MGEEHTDNESGSDAVNSAQPVESSDKGSGLFGIVIVILILLLAGTGYFLLHQLRSHQEGMDGEMIRDDKQMLQIGDQLTSLQSQISTLQSQMATLRKGMDNRESKFERELAEFASHHGGQLDTTRADLQESIDNIHSLLGRTRSDWLIADAEYLLTVANQRLHLVGDVKTAEKALNAADERLRNSGNPGVFPVREAIARELKMLSQIKPLDVVGLSAKIRILQDEAEKLPLVLPHAGQVGKQAQNQQQPAAEEEESGNVNNLLDTVMDDLKGLVVVRRSDRPIESVLTPEEARLIYEELQLKLEIARIALIKRDSDLYESSLDDALAWLKEHFRVKNKATEEFGKELEQLRKVSLQIDFPDISQSLNLLRNVASLRLDRESAEIRLPQKKEAGAANKPGAKAENAAEKQADKGPAPQDSSSPSGGQSPAKASGAADTGTGGQQP